MKMKLMLGLVLVAFVCGVSYAQEDQIKQMANLGPGVHKIKTDETTGALISCVVVGQARITTVLGLNKGLITARRDARLSAENEFTKWVETNSQGVQGKGDEQTILIQGAGNQRSESGKSIDTSTEAVVSAAKGAIRGLQVLGYDQSGGEGDSILTVVLGWSPANAVMAGQAGAVNEAEYQAPGSSTGNGTTTSGGKTPASGVPTTTIPAKTVVSDDAAKFF